MAVLLVLLAAPRPAGAVRTQVHVAAESQKYSTKAGGMLGRGLLNAVTCFVDLLVNTVNETKAGPPLIGTLTGVAKGTGCGVLRLGSGAVDVVTFWVPGFNGFPVSDSYDNCLASPGVAAYQEPAMTRTPMELPSDVPMPAAEPAPAPAKRQWKK
ncbi:MAG: exosortase system-associated protein, TIGR04073 family [Candidatus Omnitrophica bacterium]|nr:exosortase system-associated protein, TIGR04073 family [Candidatus Omnitrophota bacterium]